MNPSLPVVIVAGLGRCGTSLAMQMLAAAGLPCAGEAPAYEAREALSPFVSSGWALQQRGCAVKLLDPHLHRMPPGLPAVAFWLDRDPVEQTKSQIKLAAMVGGHDVTPDRRTRRAWERKLRADVPAALAALPAERLRLDFEAFIELPRVTATKMVLALRHAGFPGLTDQAVDRMVAVVRWRDAACLPGLLELALL